MYRQNIHQKKKQIQYSNGTVFNAFIYLKYKDDSYQDPKKIKYPQSIPSLMKIAKSLFADVVEVHSIFTKNGKKIEFIDDVIPGDTLYVSPITGNEEEEIKVNKRKSALKDEENKKFKEQASYSKLFGDPSGENERVKVKVIGNPHLSLASRNKDRSQIPTFKKHSQNANNENDPNNPNGVNGAKGANQFQSSSSMDKKNRRKSGFDDMESFSSENDTDENSLNRTSSESFNSKKGRRSSKNQESDIDGKNRNSKISRNNSAWSKASESEKERHVKESANLSEIFQKVLHEETLAKKVPESLYNLYNEEDTTTDKKENLVPLDFYTQLVNNFKTLEFYWIKKGIQIFGMDLNEDSEIYGLSEMLTSIHDIISNHRKPFFQWSENSKKNKKSRQNNDSKNNNDGENNFYSGIGYQFNLAIIGPRKSGKSTFLSLFARELLFEFVATESLKKYFIINLDLSKFVINIHRPDRFFHDIVDATLLSLQWNCPCYTQYIQSLALFFKAITEENEEIDPDSFTRNPPLVPQNFKLNPDFQHVAASFQSIANRMTYLWSNDEKFLEWNLSVLFFPLSIAQAVGIEKMIYIVDNIELFDIKVNSSSCSHFNQYNNCIFLSDLFKLVLSTGNYIISCQNQNDFDRFMEPITEEFDSSSFSNKIEYVSTLNIIDVSQQNDEEDDDELYYDKIISAYLDLEDEEIPVYISINHTGGIPVFVFLWKEINKLFDEIEQYDENSIEYQEIYETVFSQATELLYQLFVSQDGQDISSSINITKVKRSTRSEK